MGAASTGAATASKTVELALKGKHRDVRGQLFATGLLLMLLLSLALLVVLVVSVLADALPDGDKTIVEESETRRALIARRRFVDAKLGAVGDTVDAEFLPVHAVTIAVLDMARPHDYEAIGQLAHVRRVLIAGRVAVDQKFAPDGAAVRGEAARMNIPIAIGS